MRPSTAVVCLAALVAVMLAPHVLFASDAAPTPVPTIRFEGTVTDASNGKPLQGVTATVLDTSRRSLGWLQWEKVPEVWRPVSVQSDEQGRFAVEKVATRTGAVMLAKPGFGRMLVPDVDLTQPFEARMVSAASISGVALDGNGQPAGGARVTVESAEGNVQYSSATTGADGKFSFADIPPGTHMVQQFADRRASRIHHAEVRAGEAYEVDWNKPGEAELGGVVTLRGKPAAGVNVLLYPDGSQMYCGFGATDENGAYRISVHRAGKHLVTAAKGDYTDPNHTYIRGNVTIKPGKNRHDIALPGGVVSGKVVDERTGEPVSGVMVRAYFKQTEQEKFARANWHLQHIQPQWWSEKTATTDESGRFAFEEMAGGDWLVAAVPGSEGGGIAPGKPFRLEADGSREGISLSIPALGSAEVTAIDAETGKPVADIFVICKNDRDLQIFPTAETGANSSTGMRFTNLPPGTYKAFPMARGYLPASQSFEVVANQTTRVSVEMSTGSKIIFRLTETGDDMMPGVPSVGFRVTTPDGKKPVLEDFQGPYWGSMLALVGSAPREASLTIRPGEYLVETVLRRDERSNSLVARENLWSGTQTVKVEPGRNIVIEMPWKEGR